MVKASLLIVLGSVMLGCGSSGNGDGEDKGGAGGATTSGAGGVATGGSAGTSTSGGVAGGGASPAGAPAGGASVTSTAPGVIESGPECLPRGPGPEELGSAYEVLFGEPVGTVVAIETGASGAYIATEDSLYRIAPGSAKPELFITDNDFGYPNSPGADGMLRVDATLVYWASSGDIRRATVADFKVETIVTGVANVDFLEIDDQNLYFCVREENVIYKAPLTGGAPEELSRDKVSVQDMKVDSGYVYVSEFESGRIVRFPTAGGEIEYVSPSGLFTLGVRPSGDTVYWADDGGIYATPLASPDTRVLLSRPTTSGPFGGARVNNIAIRGDRLYWRDSAGAVGWTKTDGSQCDVTVAADASEFAVDAEHVYIDSARVALPAK